MMADIRDPFRELAEAKAAFGAAFRATWLWRFPEWIVDHLARLMERMKRG